MVARTTTTTKTEMSRVHTHTHTLPDNLTEKKKYENKMEKSSGKITHTHTYLTRSDPKVNVHWWA